MTSGETPLRIAMVNDDTDDIFLTKMAFKRASLPCTVFNLKSGRALFDHIKDKGIDSFDLLLIDVNMPMKNGFEVLARLSLHPDFKKLCTVMFSTSDMACDKNTAAALGSTAYAVKPSSLKETSEFVQRMWDIAKAKAKDNINQHNAASNRANSLRVNPAWPAPRGGASAQYCERELSLA